MSDPITEPEGFLRAVALVGVPVDQATALLGAASGSGWVGPLGTRTMVVTEDPADAAGVAAGASELDRSQPAVVIWTCIDSTGERSAGIAVTVGGAVAAVHEWSDLEPDPDLELPDVDQATALIEALGASNEAYLLRALLRRRTGDPEELVGDAAILLDLDPALHQALLFGPPEGFAYVEPPGGFQAWRSLMKSDALRPKLWQRLRRRSR